MTMLISITTDTGAMLIFTQYTLRNKRNTAWSGILGDRIIGPIFIEQNLTFGFISLWYVHVIMEQKLHEEFFSRTRPLLSVLTISNWHCN